MTSFHKSEFLGEFLHGECTHHNIDINNLSSLSSANEYSVSFFNDKKYLDDLKKTKAALVILKKSDSSYRSGPSIYVNDPYLAFAKIASFFNKVVKKKSVSKSSIIGNNTELGNEIHIGAFSYIGDKCNIGDGCEIGENCSIGDGVSIGKNTQIHSNVSIYHNVKIGENCIIFSGARIGADGFGYAKDKDNSWIKIPQNGSVVIGNNVDIGSNSTIDRGAIDDTIIHDGVKIDNLVQIGHNCQIGENTIIAGCAGIAGSALVGKNCMIGGAAVIKGHLSIADNTVISGGSSIGKNVNEPAKRFTNIFPYNIEHKDWLKIASNIKKLGKKNV